MTQAEMKARTRDFSIEIVGLCLTLGNDDLGRLVRPQLLRSGTGVATNYRATCRARSDNEFASRIGIVVEESDESEFWLDVLTVFKRGDARIVATLRREAEELRAMTASARATT